MGTTHDRMDAPKKKPASLRDALGHIRAEITAQLTIDRTGITDRTAPMRAKAAAWVAIIGIYIVGWGDGVRVAIAMLFEWVPIPDEWPIGTVSGLTKNIVRDVAVVLIAAALIWAFRQYANASVPLAGWKTSVKTFPVGYVAVVLGFGISGILTTTFGFHANVFDVPHIDDPLLKVLNIVNSGMAGPSEELALLALVVVALRATGHSWTVVVLAAIVVRVPFHLYYGWGAIGLAVWAALMVVLYRRTGAIVAIILEHATFNLLNYAGEAGGLLRVLIAIAGFAVVAIVIGNAIGRREKAAMAVSES